MSGRRKRKLPLKIKIIYSVLAIQLVLLGGYGAVNVYGQYLHNQLDYDDGSNVEYVPEEEQIFETDEGAAQLESMDVEAAAELFVNSDNFKGRTEDGVYNILLIGEDLRKEEVTDDARGNTDALIVASIDTNEHCVRLLSFMRDMYVQIPGYSDNRLNSAYALGGIQLLYDVFVTNFDLALDGYVMVNFASFTDIIDELGGVTITLNEEEAEYLNTSKTILDANQRNVAVGKQQLSGAQALGYSRIRKIGNNDYERTERQRNVLSAIFEAFREKNILEMASVLESILPYIKTDLTYDQMLEVAGKALSADLSDIEQERIPLDNTFRNANIRGMSVLVVEDFQTNINRIHTYLFGSDYLPETQEEESEAWSDDAGSAGNWSAPVYNDYGNTYDSSPNQGGYGNSNDTGSDQNDYGNSGDSDYDQNDYGNSDDTGYDQNDYGNSNDTGSDQNDYGNGDDTGYDQNDYGTGSGGDYGNDSGGDAGGYNDAGNEDAD